MSAISQREHFAGDESYVGEDSVAEVNDVDAGFLGTGLGMKLQWYTVNLDRLKMLAVEAHSMEEAFGIYMKAMGILNTIHKPDIHLVTDWTDVPAKTYKVPYKPSK